MTDSAESRGADGAADGAADAATAAETWAAEPPRTQAGADQEIGATAASEHPELMVGAAFAGGLLFATILKRLAR